MSLLSLSSRLIVGGFARPGHLLLVMVSVFQASCCDGSGCRITYEDNRERVDYISMYHFRACS